MPVQSYLVDIASWKDQNSKLRSLIIHGLLDGYSSSSARPRRGSLEDRPG